MLIKLEKNVGYVFTKACSLSSGFFLFSFVFLFSSSSFSFGGEDFVVVLYGHSHGYLVSQAAKNSYGVAVMSHVSNLSSAIFGVVWDFV